MIKNSGESCSKLCLVAVSDGLGDQEMKERIIRCGESTPQAGPMGFVGTETCYFLGELEQVISIGHAIMPKPVP